MIIKKQNNKCICLYCVYLLCKRYGSILSIFRYLLKVSSVFLIFLSHSTGQSLSYEREYTSSIVVDAVSGEVLYSYNPDLKIFPASLTKMMTAYVVFNAIKQGIVGVNDDVNLASNKFNKKLTIADLLYKLAVTSNNNATEILAREIYGNGESFVLKMNEFADKMNMKKTHFANTNGLHNDGNYSTARDIAKLSIRLVYDFPQYTDFFGTTNYINEDSEYSTKTSQIQDSINGIEGGKTGYLSTSGYNLVAWGKYNNRHLFVVIIGANNKVSRDALVVKLINFALKNSNIVLEKKLTKNINVGDKFFNFIGIDYNKYISPYPQERDWKKRSFASNKTANLSDVEDDEEKNNKSVKHKISYFYKK